MLISTSKFNIIGVLPYLLQSHCGIFSFLQVRLIAVVPCPLGCPLDQALVGVSLCLPLVVDTHPFVLYITFFNINYCIPFCYPPTIKHWSFSTNAFAFVFTMVFFQVIPNLPPVVKSFFSYAFLSYSNSIYDNSFLILPNA